MTHEFEKSDRDLEFMAHFGLGVPWLGATVA